MSKKIKIETCRFVPVTSIVPKNWWYWFYEAISDNAPFTWGDNNRSMVDVQTFLNHCDAVCLDNGASFVNAGAYKAWVKKIESLPEDVCIDMEN